MGKELFQFIFTISFGPWTKPAGKSIRNKSKPTHGESRSTVYTLLRQVFAFFQFLVRVPNIQIALLTGIIVMSIPLVAPASDVTLVWNDNNPAVDGYQVFQRTENQAFDYTQPAWSTDGRDHIKTSCTVADLEAGVKYYFVVRAGLGRYQSAVSNEVPFIAPAPSPDTTVNGNRPPEQPAVTSIADGENDVSLTPLLSASEFVDADPKDSHTGTEWRIFLARDGQQTILDRTREKGRLLEFRVPHLVLEPSTEYFAQVRFFDASRMPSPWSQPVVFTTAMDENDQNQNNIPDTQETPAAIDMNGDTVSDLEQVFVVKSLFTYNAQHMIGVSVELNDPTVQIQAAAGIDPAALASSDDNARTTGDMMPYGLLGYRIKVNPNEIIAVRLYLSDPLPQQMTQWVRYDVDEGMSNCDTSTDVDDSRLLVTRYLADGGEEDADGVANGVIVDLSGPRDPASIDSGLAISDDGSAAAGGSSGGCFVRYLF